jgi:hypothetical protein
LAAAGGASSAPLAARIQLKMLVSWQPNSRASSLGLRPVATKSIICWRNCAEYGALGWGILDSLFHYDKVSVKKGQLQYSGKKHFIACFKDTMLEVICREYEEVRLSQSDLVEVFQEQLRYLE